MTVTCVLADPFPLIRDGLRAMLADQPDLRIVADAGSAAAAVHQTAVHRPDVLIADLPAADLVSVCRSVRDTGVLAFTDESGDAFLMTAIRAGIRGYVPKTAEPAELARAIRGVACGHAIFGAHIAAKVTGLLFASKQPAVPGLTPREREILSLIATGQSNTAIATRLRLSAKTIRNHTSVIFGKLGVSDRAEAMLRARAIGLS
jgi:DNA-binding NarL/FixJ family response regulator